MIFHDFDDFWLPNHVFSQDFDAFSRFFTFFAHFDTFAPSRVPSRVFLLILSFLLIFDDFLHFGYFWLRFSK